jgi:hypothetical protein
VSARWVVDGWEPVRKVFFYADDVFFLDKH